MAWDVPGLRLPGPGPRRGTCRVGTLGARPVWLQGSAGQGVAAVSHRTEQLFSYKAPQPRRSPHSLIECWAALTNPLRMKPYPRFAQRTDPDLPTLRQTSNFRANQVHIGHSMRQFPQLRPHFDAHEEAKPED